MMLRPVSLALLGLVLCISNGLARTGSEQPLRRYPMSGALEVSTRSTIGVSSRTAISRSDANQRAFSVRGSRSGEIAGSTTLSDDRTTIIFAPSRPFALNEHVTVSLLATLVDGRMLRDSFDFQTELRDLSVLSKEASALLMSPPPDTAPPPPPPPPPDSFPPLPVDAWSQMVSMIDNGATPGNIFLELSQPTSGLYILNEHGTVQHSANIMGANFEKQENGEYTYYSSPKKCFYGMDSNFTVIDSFHCANGYEVDIHEFILFKDGSRCMLGVTRTTKDMSQSVSGGNASARIDGNVIQRFDRSGNLIFEWRGIDHYEVTDAFGVNFLVSAIDFEHANAIDIDSEGNYLLSNRHLCEVTKINGSTGEILWRFGGKHNEFQIVGDTQRFTYQHDARRLANGHITLFDNGNLNAVQQSRAVEYELNLQAKTATTVWEFHHNPPIYTVACGGAQRLANGNTFIGWGAPSTGAMKPSNAFTEVTPDGKVVSDVRLTAGLFSYRERKYIPEVAPPPPADVQRTSLEENGLILSLTSGARTSATVSSTVPEHAEMSLVDATGRTMFAIFGGAIDANAQTIDINTAGLPNGIYFCRLVANGSSLTRALLLQK